MGEGNTNKFLGLLSKLWKFRGLVILLLGLAVMGHMTYSFVHAEGKFLHISRRLSIEQLLGTVMIFYGLYRVVKKEFREIFSP